MAMLPSAALLNKHACVLQCLALFLKQSICQDCFFFSNFASDWVLLTALFVGVGVVEVAKAPSTTSRPLDCMSASSKSLDLKDEGNAFLKAGKFEHAIQRYSSALFECRLNSWQDDGKVSEVGMHQAIVLSNRSLANFKLEKYDRALADATEAAKANANYPKSHFRMGKALEALGKKDEAAAALALAQVADERAKKIAAPIKKGFLATAGSRGFLATAAQTDAAGNDAAAAAAAVAPTPPPMSHEFAKRNVYQLLSAGQELIDSGEAGAERAVAALEKARECALVLTDSALHGVINAELGDALHLAGTGASADADAARHFRRALECFQRDVKVAAGNGDGDAEASARAKVVREEALLLAAAEAAAATAAAAAPAATAAAAAAAVAESDSGADGDADAGAARATVAALTSASQQQAQPVVGTGTATAYTEDT